jgi:Cu(I)/Ag(I) efflux system membrane fusion protein
MMRRSVPALIGVFAVVVAAFFLGGVLLGGGSSRDAVESAGHDHSAEVSSEASVWTCSMHPQIQLPKPGKCPICFMDLIPVETGAGEELGPRQLKMSQTAKQLARIETSPVRRAFAEREVRMVGRLDYDETEVSYITAWVPGRLDRLYADFTGVRVAKGDHMVHMYSPELLAAQEELLQAKKAVGALGDTESKVLKSTAKATVEAVREKLRLLGLTEEQVSEIESSGETSDHLTIYAPIGGVVVEKNAREGMYVETGTRIYTIADLSRLWVLLEAYESDLPWLRYGQEVTFTSPSFPGETFEALISFIDPVVDPKTRTVSVRAIVENPGLKLKPEMFVSGVVSSRIDGKGNVIDEDLAGKWIGPMHPEVVKDGPGKCDVCGMPLVSAESLGYAGRPETDEDAPLLIPDSAPLITGRRAVVYVEVPNEEGPLFEGREVELGPRAGDLYVVKSGLSEGEMVVTNGAFKIDSELQIRAKPSMMSPDGGAAASGHEEHGVHRSKEANLSHVSERSRGPRGGNLSSDHDEHSEMTAEPLNESDEVRRALEPVYARYFEVQAALADDDHAGSKSAAVVLGEAVSDVDMNLFSSRGHERWMDIMRSMKSAAERMSESDDIVGARDGFFHLSNAVIDLEDSFGHAGDKNYYLAFCPMAEDNAGAYWLQTDDVIWNSFYGASMLRCGEIKKTLPPHGKETR